MDHYLTMVAYSPNVAVVFQTRQADAHKADIFGLLRTVLYRIVQKSVAQAAALNARVGES